MSTPALRLSTRLLENPFRGGRRDAWREHATRLLALPRTPPGVAGGRESDEVALTLALAHALAAVVVHGKKPSDELLPARVPERLLSRLGRSRVELVRLICAAERCQRALEGLAGDSASLGEVRAGAWSTSFGTSLLSSLRLDRVLREHDVLVTGETGTGKEAVAQAIALGTPGTADGGPAPFAVLNIAAIPETLIESELFGHVRGAFTGAAKTRTGHIRAVASGCLFLDEIGDLPATAQSKLLRVMETDRVTPLGSDQSHDADVRYIAATHQDLRAMVARGTFREDLYERLAGRVIRLPALRERTEDLLPIGLKFTARYLPPEAPEWRSVRRFLESAEARAHTWPGNVRELQNCLRNVLLGIDPGITLPLVPAGVNETTPAGVAIPSGIAEGSVAFVDVESWYLRRVLQRSGNNYALAARVLGLDRSTVRRKVRAAR